MKKIALLAALLLNCTIAVVSQNVRPTPTPEQDDVVKISTALIQVDVSVTDKKGNVVTDLKAGDFEIYENGEKQPISNFSFIANVRHETAALREKPATTDVPAPPVSVRPEQVRRTFALVVDDLSLSFESAYYTRRSLKKFVDEQMLDGDLVAIIRTGAGIGALQQFTADKRQLHAAIEKVKWNPMGSGNIGAFAPIEPTPLETQAALGDTTVSDEDLELERNRIRSMDDFQGSVFATGTLGALRYIVTGMGELPGRKSVILFSDGFKLFEEDESGSSGGSRIMDFLRQLIDLANRSSIVFYTLDARGLQTTGFTAQDNVINPTSERLQRMMSDRRDQLLDTQAGLSYLAEETGGFAVLNNNDLNRGLRRVLNDQSYYLIGYTPDSETFDAAKRRFNKLEIKVNRPGVNVRYRSGFFNVAEENVAKAPSAPKTPVEQIRAALMSPFGMNEISLRLNTLFGNDTAQGSYVRSLLHVDAKDLKFTDAPNGMKTAAFDVIAASFGDNGVPVDQLGKSYTINVNAENYALIQKKGFVYHFAFPVKKPGAYQYRVAIRDTQDGKLGSASQFIEVPNLKKGRLTISSIVLQNFSQAQWDKLSAPQAANTSEPMPSAMDDTALRRFKLGGVLRYGYEFYNARLDASRKPNLTTKVRVFRDGKLLLDGQPLPMDMARQNDMLRLQSGGAIKFGAEMTPGDYVLQVIVTDNLAKEKRRTATQFVQFEIE